MATFPKNFRRVAEQIYAGGAPDANFLSFFKNTLNGKTVLSLDNTVSAAIDPIVKSLKMNHITFPLNASDPGVTDNVKNLIRAVQGNLFANSQPIYVHCLHGSDRTGFAIALWRTMKQNMGCEQAISEAVRFGYGQGMSLPTQKLWKSILCTKGANLATGTDTSQVDDDIVQTMRDDFSMGNIPLAFSPQQSWAPEIDLRNQSSSVQDCSDKKQSRNLRRIVLKDILQDVNDNSIPMIGSHNNYGPIAGAGPIENSGILQIL
jgi:hypothetical protein